ncbi:hypothetical protein [Kushneria aurantia]|uniref:Uncharacterized protein n=1 Tax=Kushneria aurantia TaxID=504092 RepID=A0ABV6G4J1_9GAMM|nr:hypothetical protein [Kushneria aurantia]
MANPYFDNRDESQRFQPGTIAEAEAVDEKFDRVATGFEAVRIDTDRALKLPAEPGVSREITATALQRRSRVVGFDSEGGLALISGFAWRGDWAANTEYFVNDVVVRPTSKNWYVCRERHVSGAIFGITYWSLALDYDSVRSKLESGLQPLVTTATNAAQTATTRAAQTAQDRSATGADRTAVEQDRQTAAKAAQTATTRAAQTAQDRNATSADRNATAQDRQAAASSESAASASASTASQSAAAAENARQKSRQWADASTGTEIEPGRYSARHWADAARDTTINGVSITELKPGALTTLGDYPSVDNDGSPAVRNAPDDIRGELLASNPAALLRYDLQVNTTYQGNGTSTVDIDVSEGPQVVVVGNSVLRTVRLNKPPLGRSILVIVYAEGAGGLSFSQLPSPTYWSGGELPETGQQWTQYLLWWSGATWRGNVGMKQ